MNSVTESRKDGAGTAETETNVIDLLRRFHYGEPAASAKTTAPGGDVLPALLNPYRDASTIRYQYPLYLLPPNPEPSNDESVLARPISEHLADSVETFALGADDARILKDKTPLTISMKHDDRYLQVHALPVYNKNHEVDGILEFYRDVTLEKTYEQQLQQADKLASLGQLVSGIGHEINNPNQFIRGNIKIIKQALDDMLSTIIDSGHSRFPVIGEDRDEVLGILFAKDLLRHFRKPNGEQLDVQSMLRPASVIPESKRLNALLKEFRASHNHMAIVVDEYGGVAGLLTIEDVLEEIVGEIDDEHDPEEAEFIRAEGERNGKPCFAVRALTRVEDFNEFFECDLSDEEYDTIGGLVMHELGRLPRRGEKVRFGGFEFAIVKADRRRIDSLQVQRNG